MTTTPSGKVYSQREAFRLDALHPRMKKPIFELITATDAFSFRIGRQKAAFRPFEGFRHPLRQHNLFTMTKNTKAGPWESAHQYGLAVDFAVWIDEKELTGDTATPGLWSWSAEAPWDHLRNLASRVGLDVPISWDQGHVEHPLFKILKKAV